MVLQARQAVSLDAALGAGAGGARLAGEVRAAYSEGRGFGRVGAADLPEVGRMEVRSAVETDYAWVPGSVALRGGVFGGGDAVGIEAIVGVDVAYLEWDGAVAGRRASGSSLELAPLVGAQLSARLLPGITVQARGACALGGDGTTAGYELRLGNRTDARWQFAAGWRQEQRPEGAGLAGTGSSAFCEWTLRF